MIFFRVCSRITWYSFIHYWSRNGLWLGGKWSGDIRVKSTPSPQWQSICKESSVTLVTCDQDLINKTAHHCVNIVQDNPPINQVETFSFRNTGVLAIFLSLRYHHTSTEWHPWTIYHLLTVVTVPWQWDTVKSIRVTTSHTAQTVCSWGLVSLYHGRKKQTKKKWTGHLSDLWDNN